MFRIILLLAVGSTYALKDLGDECIVGRTRKKGECQLWDDCKQLHQRRRGEQPTVCGYMGREVVVCCPVAERVLTTPPPNNSNITTISGQKCKEYGEYVYTKFNVSTVRGIVVERNDMCGHKVIPLVVGGEDAKEKEFPHMALLGYNYEGDFRWSCGGSLISEQFVMTAAHCTTSGLYGKLIRVRLGELDISTARETDYTVDFDVAEIIRHPEYRGLFHYHDIALVRLNGYVTMNPYVRPACLPTESRITQELAIATGWGATENAGTQLSNRLQKVVLDLYTHAECQYSFPPDPNSIQLPDGVQESSQLCAGSRYYRRDTCQSDSGGPLQVYNTDPYCTYKIIGITSFGVGCGVNVNLPAVYIRVYAYLDWIESIVWPQKNIDV